MEEEANITLECLKFAQQQATRPETKDDIGRAIEWVFKLAALQYEINAKHDAQTDL